MLKLYYSPGACSLSPHIALREAGLTFDLEQVNLKEKKTKSGEDYLKINPKGYVPALKLDNGYVLTEGPAIVQYIADQRPKLNLAPENGSPERYQLQEWLTYIGTEIHKTFSPLFNPATPEDYKAVAKEYLGKRFAYVDEKIEGPGLSDGLAFHGRRRLSVHGDELGELRCRSTFALSELEGIPGARCGAAEGARGAEGRRAVEVVADNCSPSHVAAGTRRFKA